MSTMVYPCGTVLSLYSSMNWAIASRSCRPQSPCELICSTVFHRVSISLDQVDSILDRYRCRIDMLNTCDSSLSPLEFPFNRRGLSLSPVGNTILKQRISLPSTLKKPEEQRGLQSVRRRSIDSCVNSFLPSSSGGGSVTPPPGTRG